MEENTGRNTDNLIPWKKGDPSPNPNGRPMGQRNYATIYKEALQILADKNSTTPEKLEAEMVANAAMLARKGNYQFYKDIQDRLHGQPKGSLDVSAVVETKDAFTDEQKQALLALLK